MKDYEVQWTSTAQSDVRNILSFIINDGISRSKQLLNQLRDRGNKLKTNPGQGRIVPELAENNIYTYREVFHKPWRIIYRIDNNRVYIVSVIDGRRNIEDILLRRILEM
ncbi:MAG: type II toxin-antitoxin system RelE/ParE family toxin [Spirochaetes bacterium]|nr:type II toxin-antitoxin system RelE/ParE family toxin [Spirochaetota bacterium]MBN2771314.1 type II toxin-antitoxin system RelE/ParE family toxin [Spirochaetota bacterium]